MKPPKAPGRSDCRADPPRPPGAPAVTGSPPALRPPTVVTEPRGRKGIKNGENDKNNTIKLVVVPCSRAEPPGDLGGVAYSLWAELGVQPRGGGSGGAVQRPGGAPGPPRESRGPTPPLPLSGLGERPVDY